MPPSAWIAAGCSSAHSDQPGIRDGLDGRIRCGFALVIQIVDKDPGGLGLAHVHARDAAAVIGEAHACGIRHGRRVDAALNLITQVNCQPAGGDAAVTVPHEVDFLDPLFVFQVGDQARDVLGVLLG